MKRDHHFKLSKTSKRLMATLTDPHERGKFREMMIDAQITASSNDRMTMMYDIAPNGKKRGEKLDPSKNSPVKVV